MLALGLLAAAQILFLVWRHPDAIAPIWYVAGGVGAGLNLGVSLQLSSIAHASRLLALLKGEGMRSDSASAATPDSVPPLA